MPDDNPFDQQPVNLREIERWHRACVGTPCPIATLLELLRTTRRALTDLLEDQAGAFEGSLLGRDRSAEHAARAALAQAVDE